MQFFRNGQPVSFDNFDGPSDEQIARAEARTLDHGHHAARRNGVNLNRALSTADRAGVWGASQHRNTNKPR